MTTSCRWCGGRLSTRRVNPDEGTGCLALLLSTLIAMVGVCTDAIVTGRAGTGTFIAGFLALMGFVTGAIHTIGTNTYKVMECDTCGSRQ